MTQNASSRAGDTRRVRLGIVGLGLAGGAMVPVAMRHDRIELVAAADPNALLRQRFTEATGLPAYEDDQAMLAQAEVDAVYIATPHQFHASQTVYAAGHGKHLVVEKPMALTLADCDVMVAAAERAGVTLIVGHTHSFDPPVHCMRDYARDQALGPLAMVAMWTYTDFLYRPRRPEELDTSKGGGILFNQVPHQVDVARLLAGSPVRAVRAWTGMLDPARPTEGASTVFLDFECGAAASLTYSGYDYFDTDEFFDWVNANGRRKQPGHGSARRALQALADPADEHRLKSERYGFGGGHASGEVAHQPHFGTLVATYQGGDLRPSPEGMRAYTAAGVQEVNLPAGRTGRDSVLDELCAVLLDGATATHDGAFARGTLDTCLAIQRSAAERREVVLRPAR